MHTTLAGKRIVVGVTGSIAAFKVAGWVSRMTQEEALVDVILTDSACRFVTSLTFGALAGRRVYTDMFEAEKDGEMSHIQLGREADCLVIAPATAQTIARLAGGFADNLLATTALACRAPVIVCPAMNVHMHEHRATRQNLERLKDFGYQVVEPGCGRLACGDEGSGRLAEWEEIQEYVLRATAARDLTGQRVLVTAGPTRETCDPARFISNRSSGKMGFAIARAAFRRGASVTLITGPTALSRPAGIRTVEVESAQEMYEAVMQHYRQATAIIKAAAVSDFRCKKPHLEKVKKEQASGVMELEQTTDILRQLGEKRDSRRQLLVGFAAESSAIEAEGKRKLTAKKLDLIAVNDISQNTGGFEVDTNQLLLIDPDSVTRLPHTSKIKTADLLWDHLVNGNYLRPADQVV